MSQLRPPDPDQQALLEACRELVSIGPPHGFASTTVEGWLAHFEAMVNLEMAGANGFRLYPDGSMWCALLGPDLQDGVCGFGATPYEAVVKFLVAKAEAPVYADGTIARHGDVVYGTPLLAPFPMTGVVCRVVPDPGLDGHELMIAFAWPKHLSTVAFEASWVQPIESEDGESALPLPYARVEGVQDRVIVSKSSTVLVHAPDDTAFMIETNLAWGHASRFLRMAIAHEQTPQERESFPAMERGPLPLSELDEDVQAILDRGNIPEIILRVVDEDADETAMELGEMEIVGDAVDPLAPPTAELVRKLAPESAEELACKVQSDEAVAIVFTEPASEFLAGIADQYGAELAAAVRDRAVTLANGKTVKTTHLQAAVREFRQAGKIQ